MQETKFLPHRFGLKKGYLYEVLASTYYITEDGKAIKPNTACMGIRLVENNKIKINPYPTTVTFKNIKEHSVIALNFVDNVYLYALAALKEKDFQIGLTEFPTEYYDFKHLPERAMDVPFIKEAWGILICEVESKDQRMKEDSLGVVMLTEFLLKVIYSENLRESFKIFNRSENLALEAIILATRIKVAKYSRNQELLDGLLKKFRDISINIERFGKNKDAIKAMGIVNKYVSSLID